MLISKFGADNIEDRLDDYEKKIGRKIPGQLRSFLEKYNGGETPNTNFKCNHITSDIRYFYGMGEVKYSYHTVEPIEENNRKYLPFASDSFGNEIVIDMDSEEIQFLDHENRKMEKLANDLYNFIKMCESKSINPAAVKSVEQREKDLIQRGRGNIITEALREMWRAEIEKYSGITLEEVEI